MSARPKSLNAANVLVVVAVAAVVALVALDPDALERLVGTEAERCAWAERKVAETGSALWEGYRDTTCAGVRP